MTNVNCRRCGRVLKNPQSAERKIGPVCYRREQAILRMSAPPSRSLVR